MKGYLKNIISYYSSALIINSQNDAEVYAPIASCLFFLLALENVENDLGEVETS